MSLVVDSLHWLERLVFKSRQQRRHHTELPRLYRAALPRFFSNTTISPILYVVTRSFPLSFLKIFCLLLAAILSVWQYSPTAAADSRVASFVEVHCVSCHGTYSPDGGLSLEGLATQFDDPANAAIWIRVFDKVVTGEMPPKKETQPKPAERTQFTEHLRDKLHAASLQRQLAEGRVVFRRLNRIEYENTLRDLLGMPVHVREILPEDGGSAGFDTISAALEISPTHLVRFQQAADRALAAAMTTSPPNV